MMQINKIFVRGKSYIFFSVIILGFSSLLTQLVIIREFYSVFDGNELIFGLLLSSWMSITATGALIIKFILKKNINPFVAVVFQILLSILPALCVYLIRYTRFTIFPAGAGLNPIDIFIFAFAVSLPYCLISGMMFAVYSQLFSFNENKTGNVYFYETLGSIVGGALFSFVLIFVLNTFEILAVIYGFNLISVLLLAFYFTSDIYSLEAGRSDNSVGNKHKIFSLIIKYLIPAFSVLIIIPFLFNIDLQTKQYLYKNQSLLENMDTPYGNLVITRTSEQLNFFSDGILMFSTGNPMASEEAVHYAMIQCRNPKYVLLLSGGISGTANEILKYAPYKIDYVELNPFLIELGNKYIKNINHAGINAVAEDGRIFVRNTNENYDAAIINLPEPSTAQFNRYYSCEFFRELKLRMTKGSVISLSLPSTENYVSKEAAELNSSIYVTLKKVFKNVIIIPGGKNYFIASDMTLTYDIGKRTDEMGIENIYVNKYYYDEPSMVQRAENILSSLNYKAQINHDFFPVSYYQQINYKLSYFGINNYILIIITAILLLVILLRMKPLGWGLFAGGFTAIGSEIVVLFAFQVIFGYVYYMYSVIITAFMLGLAIGAFVINSYSGSTKINFFLKIQILITIYSIVLPSILMSINYGLNKIFTVGIILILILIISLLTGIQFATALKIDQKGFILSRGANQGIIAIASETYSADLFGSAFGALLVSGFLIPITGISNTCFIMGGINMAALIVIFIRNKFNNT